MRFERNEKTWGRNFERLIENVMKKNSSWVQVPNRERQMARNKSAEKCLGVCMPGAGGASNAGERLGLVNLIKIVFLMGAHGFSCFCYNLHVVPSIEKKIINFSILQTVVCQTSLDGTTCRL